MFIPSMPLGKTTAQKMNWTTYKKMFGQPNITVDNIRYEQWKYIGQYTKRFNSSGILQELNASTIPWDGKELQLAAESTMSQIETNFFGLRDKVQMYKNNLPKLKAFLQQLITNYNSILSKYSGNGNTNEANAAIEQLKINIAALENIITPNISSQELVQKILEHKVQRQEGSKKHGMPSLIRSLAGIGSALRGMEFEVLAVENLEKKIPAQNQNMTTARTANIRVAIGQGRGINIKEDLAVIDISSNIFLEMANGTRISLKELLEKNKQGREIIVLSQSGYEQLQKAMIAGFSAKAVKGGRISLHSGLTVDKILKTVPSTDDSQNYWYLYHLWQISNANSRFRGNYNTNAMLINYNMSKMLSDIIGRKNFFIVTQNGFTTTQDFLQELIINKKKYIKVSPVSYTKGMQVIAQEDY